MKKIQSHTILKDLKGIQELGRSESEVVFGGMNLSDEAPSIHVEVQLPGRCYPVRWW
jgi:hypothetical protein